MLSSVYLQKLSNLFAQNRVLKFSVIVLTIGFCYNTYKVNEIKDRIRTVIVPPVINSKIEISGSWTTDAYAKEYIRYIGSLIWNYSPGVARGQFGELLVSWHPSVFEVAKKRLYILSDQIEQTKAASVFYISRIEHNHDKHTIEVTGNRRLTQQDIQQENTVKTYIVSYLVENGHFWITAIDEKVDGAGVQIGVKTPVK